jgi:hypothetical protein
MRNHSVEFNHLKAWVFRLKKKLFHSPKQKILKKARRKEKSGLFSNICFIAL